MKKLILHADDFGLTEGINRGILTAFKQGVVSSASLLVNFSQSLPALRAGRAEGLDLGWHLNLTQGRPLSSPQDISSLIRPDGSFYPLRDLIRRCFFRQVVREEVARELTLQYKVFVEGGSLPTHLDGHQHIHLLPVIREAVREIVSRYRIPFVRIPSEKGSPLLPRWPARFFLRSLDGARPQFWNKVRVRSIPFYGLSLGKKDLPSWGRLLKRIKEGVAEVMVHPGIRNLEDDTVDDYPGDREQELSVLMSPEWKALVRNAEFQLVDYGDL